MVFRCFQGLEKECIWNKWAKGLISRLVYNNMYNVLSYTDVSDASKKQFRELQVKYFELKEKHDDLTEKLKFFTKVIKV